MGYEDESVPLHPEPKKDNFIDKQTLVRSNERIKFHVKIYANKFFSIDLTWAFNPDDPFHLDQIMTEDKHVWQAYESMKEKLIKQGFTWLGEK